VKHFIVGFLFYLLAQTIAWFQSNGLLVFDWMANHKILCAMCTGPFIAYFFAIGTEAMYMYFENLWPVRFLGFASGYLIFIPLTWFFFGESPFTLKNLISFLLCCGLIATQLLIPNAE
tara:strand:+ start:15176 stop:15529 length:354 start_codon:yes stop_codon:yes gene_type:complete